ncbi:hypothetical protein ACI65C_005147 [Semiaphis heraclei]
MKDDPEFNIKFVEIVENHKCIYDYNIKEYASRVEQDRAWENIGKEIGATASECKERWKNLRACYTRHLKHKLPSGSGAKPKRPYYLAEYLNFLEPFTKSRKQTGNIPVNLNTVNENLNENDLENSDDQADDNESADQSFDNFSDPNSKEDSLYSPSTSSANVNKNKKKLAPVLLSDVNKAALDFFSKRKKTDTEEDMDLCFLKSLLPDMKLMTPDQKRRYKVQMINAASCILSEHIVSAVNQHQTYAFTPPDQRQTQEPSTEKGMYTYPFYNQI